MPRLPVRVRPIEVLDDAAPCSGWLALVGADGPFTSVKEATYSSSLQALARSNTMLHNMVPRIGHL